MRYYDIQLYQAGTNNVATGPNGTPYRWQSFPGGLFNPAAQNIEFDFVTTVDDTPLGGSSLRIEGVSLQDLQYGQQFGAQLINGQYKAGYDIRIYGGMGKGLPLANPAQQGLILSGTIFQSYGNWQGTDMTLDFVIFPAKAFVQPVNLVFNWPAHTELSNALATTFSNALPGFKQYITISPVRTLNNSEWGAYSSFDRFALAIRNLTKGQISSKDPGVSIVVQGGAVYAYDGTTPFTPKSINFFDLIGQPTWLNYAQIQIPVVMRGDIQVGDVVSLPTGITNTTGAVTQTAQGYAGFRTKSIFNGNFRVVQIRQIGSFRSSNSTDWITIMNCVAENQS